jgi:hypothetical protein
VVVVSAVSSVVSVSAVSAVSAVAVAASSVVVSAERTEELHHLARTLGAVSGRIRVSAGIAQEPPTGRGRTQ